MLRLPRTLNSQRKIRLLLCDHFRCADEFIADFQLTGELSRESGFFRFGPDILSYGQCSVGVPAGSVSEPLYQACKDVTMDGSGLGLPFDPAQVIQNLLHERYASLLEAPRSVSREGLVRNLYYQIRPWMPTVVRKHLQRLYLRGWDKIRFPQWPFDATVDNLFEQLLVLSLKSSGIRRMPFIWFWPRGVHSCTILTHDVETAPGLQFCGRLMDIDDSFGLKSSFQIVPEERYPVPVKTLRSIQGRGFEVNVQDLNHDGLLFREKSEFLRRAQRINEYGRQWGARGFRSAVLYRNTDWFDALEFSYDMSIPSVAHLEAQRGGCCTVFPFFVGNTLELPVTTVQDYSLFNIIGDYSIEIWKQQISLILAKHGLISLITHPDYLVDRRPQRVYTDLLQYLAELQSAGETWVALPRDVDEWWRLRSELRLVKSGAAGWTIEGEGRERARLAYATLVDDHLKYEILP